MIEGSGSLPLTNESGPGPGSRRPKNMWIRIRIRIRIRNTGHSIISFKNRKNRFYLRSGGARRELFGTMEDVSHQPHRQCCLLSFYRQELLHLYNEHRKTFLTNNTWWKLWYVLIKLNELWFESALVSSIKPFFRLRIQIQIFTGNGGGGGRRVGEQVWSLDGP